MYLSLGHLGIFTLFVLCLYWNKMYRTLPLHLLGAAVSPGLMERGWWWWWWWWWWTLEGFAEKWFAAISHLFLTMEISLWGGFSSLVKLCLTGDPSRVSSHRTAKFLDVPEWVSPALAQLGWDGMFSCLTSPFPRSSVAPATPKVLPELRKPKAHCTFQLCPCCARQTHEGNPNVSEGRWFCIEHSKADRDCLVNILNIHVFLVFVTELCRAVLPPANLPWCEAEFSSTGFISVVFIPRGISLFLCWGLGQLCPQSHPQAQPGQCGPNPELEFVQLLTDSSSVSLWRAPHPIPRVLNDSLCALLGCGDLFSWILFHVGAAQSHLPHLWWQLLSCPLLSLALVSLDSLHLTFPFAPGCSSSSGCPQAGLGTSQTSVGSPGGVTARTRIRDWEEPWDVEPNLALSDKTLQSFVPFPSPALANTELQGRTRGGGGISVLGACRNVTVLMGLNAVKYNGKGRGFWFFCNRFWSAEAQRFN